LTGSTINEEVWSQIRTMSRDRYSGFETLIKYRVRNILLVASLYDAFTLEEGGRLTELILSEYREMNLSSAPHITRATSAEEALELIGKHEFDLVITLTRIGDMAADVLAEKIKAVNGLLPVIVLGYNTRELDMIDDGPGSAVDRVFIWSGDVSLLLAIIKYVEDMWNVDDDTRHGDVRVIILVEDSIRFYSSYLPMLFTQVMRQTHDLMAGSMNISQKLLRMRARPKILFATNFEEAWDYYNRYREYMLGAICDARFLWRGVHRGDAGVEFIRRLKADDPQLPTVLQSSEVENRETALEIGAGFIHKHSPRLLQDLREFMHEHFGFGDFIFRMPDGDEVGRAANTGQLIREIKRIPAESLCYHAAHDDFSNWLRARTKFRLARMIKPMRADEFQGAEDLRKFLVDTFTWYREESHRGMVMDFSRQTFDASSGFIRIGTGSLGGKARGLAFMNYVLNHFPLQSRFKDVAVKVPPTAVVATDVFMKFLDQDNLRDFAIHAETDQDVADAFMAAKLPPEIYDDLRIFLDVVRYPLAVRSSSLLEDAQHQPFAGVYSTYMIQNNHEDLNVRLDQLCDAIKLVYASTFSQGAKSYLAATSNRVEEEKMGVIIQQVVGSRHEDYVYPNFAGAAHSTNHYASEDIQPEDGVALVALGLGRMVMDGGQCLRFSPRHPQKIMQFANVEETLRNSQRQFQAIDISDPDRYPVLDEESNVACLELSDAEKHGTLELVGSVYDPENDAIYDGIWRKGSRLVTFAHILKSDEFPLADILNLLLDMGRRCMSCEVEIEFAVNIHKNKPSEFGMLQIRPLTTGRDTPALSEELLSSDKAIIATKVALGNGTYENIKDVVFVDPEAFDRGKSVDIAEAVGHLNQKMLNEEKPYMLIGPGRWGSSDHWLGIPVNWAKISGASVIVESDLDDFKVTPSQGSHFFQNLTSFQIGYLTVNQTSGGGRLDWQWFIDRAKPTDSSYLKHVELESPLRILVDGRKGCAVVLEE
jgi:pyruvate phosphate dikinase-like enzyme